LDEKDEKVNCNAIYFVLKKVFFKACLKLEMNEGLFVNVEGDTVKICGNFISGVCFGGLGGQPPPPM
jgi:hypothetical protein